MLGISKWMEERHARKQTAMEIAIKRRKTQLEKKSEDITRKKEQAYQQLKEYCLKGDVAGQRAAAKRCAVFEKYIHYYRIGIETLDQALLVLETGELNAELKRTLGEVIKLTSIEIPNDKFIAAMEEFRERMQNILGVHEEIAEILEPGVENAEIESIIAKAKAEIAVPKAKVGLEEKEENAV
jgi:hypothetical protein